MQIKLSRQQWEEVGKQKGWLKTAQQVNTKAIQNTLAELTKPEFTSAVTSYNPKADTANNLLHTCFQVIVKNIAPKAKILEQQLNDLGKTNSKLQAETTGIIANSWLGWLAGVGDEAQGLYQQGALGTKGVTNGSRQKLQELIGRIKSALPAVTKSVNSLIGVSQQAQPQAPAAEQSQPQVQVQQASAKRVIIKAESEWPEHLKKGRFTEYCKKNGFEGPCKECANKALKSDDASVRGMASFYMNTVKP